MGSNPFFVGRNDLKTVIIIAVLLMILGFSVSVLFVMGVCMKMAFMNQKEWRNLL